MHNASSRVCSVLGIAALGIQMTGSAARRSPGEEPREFHECRIPWTLGPVHPQARCIC